MHDGATAAPTQLLQGCRGLCPTWHSCNQCQAVRNYPHHHLMLSHPIPSPLKKSISLSTIPSLLYLLEKYGLVFLLSTRVRGTDSSVKK